MKTDSEAAPLALLARSLIAVVLFGALAACSPSAKWTEDVELQSGEVLVVEREQTWDIYREIGGPSAYRTKTASLRIVSAAGRSVPPWQAKGLSPMVFERDSATDEYVIVATVDNCLVWVQGGKPKPPYWKFRLRGQEWMQVPLSEDLLGHLANLSITKLPDSGGGHLTIDAKRAVDQNRRIGDYYRAVQPQPRDFHC